ncbi:MAG TPA: TGS domain-containing protein, partial [Burkholderiaceae bacterium]|nr:TGS domain-containing protein [Burkholderiaceae bacterium]
HLSFSQVLDVYGFRVVVRTLPQCYLALGTLHGLFKPVPGKFKDYIAIPKVNGYQSLHTTLIGPFGTPVEFQIRTEEMHRVAESGVAAHWLYKIDDASLNDLQQRTHSWMQSLVEMQHQSGDAAEFLEHVKIDLFPDAVYVFTPKSRIVSLPRGATAVDFAYQIHTDVGNRAIGARVNGVTVPLRSALKSGDIVEITTAPHSKPNPNWLTFVHTAKARAEIRHALRTTGLPESIALGEQLLRQASVALGIAWGKVEPAVWERMMRETGTHSRDELLADIGLGRRIAAVVARRMLAALEGTPAHGEALAAASRAPVGQSVIIHGTEGMAVQLAKCCCPIPGDQIAGHLRKGSGLMIHTTECATARRLRAKDPERWLDDVAWADDDMQRVFDARVLITARNERGVLGHVAAEITRSESNIAKISSQDEPETGLVELDIVVQVSGRVHLASVMRHVKHLPAVVRIQRVKG